MSAYSLLHIFFYRHMIVAYAYLLSELVMSLKYFGGNVAMDFSPFTVWFLIARLKNNIIVG